MRSVERPTGHPTDTVATDDDRVGDVARCPECGRTGGTHPFCGNCGARLRDRTVAPESPAPAIDRGPDATDTEADRPVGRTRRPRVLVAGVASVALVSALGALLLSGAPREVVTVPGDGSNSGVTSTLAPDDLTTEHWRLPLTEQEVEDLGRVGVLLGHDHAVIWLGDSASITVDRDDPTRRVVPPIGPYGDPFDVTGEGDVAHVLAGGLVAEVDRTSGRTSEVTTTELGASLQDTIDLRPAGAGHLVGWTHDRVIVLDATFEHGWELALEAPVLDVAEVGGTLVVSSGSGLLGIDLATGDERWRGATGTQPVYDIRVAGSLVLWSSTPALVALDAGTGETVWEVDAVGARWDWNDEEVGLASVEGRGTSRSILRVDLGSGDVLGEIDGPFLDGWSIATAEGLVVGASTGITRVDVFPPERVELLRPDGTTAWTAQLDPDTEWITLDPRTDAPAVVSVPPDGPVAVLALPDREPLFSLSGLDLPAGPRAWMPGPMALHDGVLAIPGGQGPRGDDPYRFVELATGVVLTELRPEGQHLRATSAGFTAAAFGAVYGTGGEARWRGRPPHHLVASTAHGLVVVDPAAPDRALLLDHDDGEPVGEPVDLPSPYGPGWSVDGQASAVVTGDVVLLRPDRFERWWGEEEEPQDRVPARLVALRASPRGLEELWTTAAGTGAPLTDGHVAVEATSVTVRVRDLADGSLVADHLLPVVLDRYRVLAEGLLVGRTALGGLAAVDVRTGALAWEVELDAIATSPPVVAGEVVLVGLADGRVARVHLDGRRLEDVRTGDAPVHEIVAAHGVLVVRDRDAVVMLGPAELPASLTDRDRAGGTVELPAPPGS